MTARMKVVAIATSSFIKFLSITSYGVLMKKILVVVGAAREALGQSVEDLCLRKQVLSHLARHGPYVCANISGSRSYVSLASGALTDIFYRDGLQQ